MSAFTMFWIAIVFVASVVAVLGGLYAYRRGHAHRAVARESERHGWDENRQRVERANARRLRSWKHQRRARRR